MSRGRETIGNIAKRVLVRMGIEEQGEGKEPSAWGTQVGERQCSREMRFFLFIVCLANLLCMGDATIQKGAFLMEFNIFMLK
jgi:hypothetical protein